MAKLDSDASDNTCVPVFPKGTNEQDGIVLQVTFWLIPLVLWGFLRFVLFEGLQGADDLEHLRFAWELDRIPANHWELRLPYNFFLAGCLRLFGFNEFSAAMPGLAGSLMTLIFSGLTVRSLTGSQRSAMIAMMVVCLLPTNVLGASIVGSTRVLGTGLLSFAVWCLLTRTGWAWTMIGGVCLGIIVDCHLSFLFFIGVFLGTIALMLPMYRRKVVTMWLIGGSVFFLLDPLPWWILKGDPLYRLHVIEKTHLGNLATDINKRVLFHEDGSLNVHTILKPIQDFLFSKQFAILPLLMLFVGFVTARRQSPTLRALFVSGCVYWIYMSYGTHTPTGYELFPGTVAYWEPLTIPLALVIGSSLLLIAQPLLRNGLAVTTAGLCLVLMSLSGPWGQNVEISKQFLAWVKAHPEMICVVDDRTAREMRILNGMITPENLRLVPDSVRDEVWNVPCVQSSELQGTTCVMINVLNDPDHAVAGHHIPDNSPSVAWLHQYAGDLLHQTSAAWRPAAYVVPESLRPEFLSRRPVSGIHRCLWPEAGDDYQDVAGSSGTEHSSHLQ